MASSARARPFGGRRPTADGLLPGGGSGRLARWDPGLTRRGKHGRVRVVSEAARSGRSVELVGLDDETLIGLVAAADHDAFRLLVERHLERVHRIAWRMLADHGEAEEVAQEALIRAWVHAPQFDPARGARFTTWLHRVVLNLCLDRHRRRRWHAPLGAAAEVAADAPHPLTRITETETARQVAAALAALPERQRVAVVLCYYERMSNADAAAALGISVTALEGLLVRARRTLRRLLERR